LKKITILPLVLLILTLLASGCGGQAQESAVPLQTETTETADTNSNIAPVSNVTAPVAQSQPGTTDDVVTEQTYINLYNQVNPAVVNIQVIGQPLETSFQMPELPEGEEGEETPENPFENIPGLPEGFSPDDFQQIPSAGQGSGFVYDTAGHIVTNNHVVEGAEEITVIFADGTEAEATIVGTDPGSDLAVIQVAADATNLIPVAIGDSDALQVGQLVATIGNPYGLDGSMSTGIVAGLGRTLPGAAAPGGASFNIPNIIQTDAVINPGNSGGPLLNLDGQVIGVNTAIETDPSGFSFTPSFGGVGYAVPSNILRQVVPQLIETGEVEHPWMGISGGNLTADVAEAMNLDAGQNGVLIQEVLEDGPAIKAGLRGSNSTTSISGFDVPIGGDVIVQIDDQVVNEFEDLLGYIVTRAAVGQEVTIKIIRDGELLDVTLTLEARPSVEE
jgi:S1-C subfamily serine protease